MRSRAYPKVAPGEPGTDRGVLATIRAFGLTGSLLTLGTGSRDGEGIGCNGPGETAVRTEM